MQNENSFKPLGHPAGPYGRSEVRCAPPAQAEGSRVAKWFQFFSFALHEYDFGFQDFLTKIVVNATKKVQKNSLKSSSQNIKIDTNCIEMQHW